MTNDSDRRCKDMAERIRDLPVTAADEAYDRLHGVDGHAQSVTPGRIPPARHEHDAADYRAAFYRVLERCEELKTSVAEHQWNALEMARKADLAERRAEEAEFHVEQLRDARDRAERQSDRLEAHLHGLKEPAVTPRYTSGGPDPDDLDALRGLLDLMADFPNNDQRARYLLTSNWMRDKLAANQPPFHCYPCARGDHDEHKMNAWEPGIPCECPPCTRVIPPVASEREAGR